ncbi:MAG: DUF3833 family protein [Sphingomicrobium sp.]
MRIAAAAAIALLAAGTAAAAPEPSLDMLAFFSGRTHADNVLKVALKPSAKLVVDSIGGKGDRGDFVLIDTVHEGDKPVRTRKWIMRPVGPDHYTGSLSDAVGPVDVVVRGGTATIRYTMKGGLKVTEVMQLKPDLRTMSNSVVVRKFGMKFATVDGTIRKLD